MERRNNKRGFTLAELLIVVAIIAVLVAIAIPIFTKQLEKSRESTDVSNVRSAAAEVAATYLADGTTKSAKVTAKQKEDEWQIGSASAIVLQQSEGTEISAKIPYVIAPNQYTVKITGSGVISVTSE